MHAWVWAGVLGGARLGVGWSAAACTGAGGVLLMWQCELLCTGERVGRQARLALRAHPLRLKLTLSTFAIPGEAVEARGRSGGI